MSPSIRADPGARTLTVDPKAMRVRSVITSIEPDRAGDVVVHTGLRNRDEYLMNPVVLWAHDRVRVPPIGSCAWLDVHCLLYTSPSPRDLSTSRMPSSA